MLYFFSPLTQNTQLTLHKALSKNITDQTLENVAIYYFWEKLLRFSIYKIYK